MFYALHYQNARTKLHQIIEICKFCGLNYVKQILELDSLAEHVNVGLVKVVCVDVGDGASEKVTSANSKDLAHGVASVEYTILAQIGCPHEIILLNNLDNDHIVGNTCQQICKVLVQLTLLPDAPQHPLMPERGEIRSDVFLILCLRVSPSPCPGFHLAYILLCLNTPVGVKAPFTT